MTTADAIWEQHTTLATLCSPFLLHFPTIHNCWIRDVRECIMLLMLVSAYGSIFYVFIQTSFNLMVSSASTTACGNVFQRFIPVG